MYAVQLGCCRVLQVIDDPSSDSLLLVMEYVAGGSLEQAPVSPLCCLAI
jgi:hypothetical protein